jgi:hypothetical protein
MFMVCYARPSERVSRPVADDSEKCSLYLQRRVRLDRRLSAAGHRG